MAPEIWHAYAKINLTLDVVGKREDGYHLLEMVMQSVTLWDQLSVKRCPASGVKVICRAKEFPKNGKDTVTRAAQAFYQACGINGEGVFVELEKKIPSQAGMGGASADAAAMLRAMNVLYETGLSEEELCQIGVQVGADVPFCLTGGTKLVKGIGEQISSLPQLPDCFLVACKPPVGVDTKAAFSRIDQKPGKYSPCTDRMCRALESGNLEQIAGCMGNQFESALELAEVSMLKQQMLEYGAVGACMTGSGSVVFGLFRKEDEASRCLESVSNGENQAFICRPYFGKME